MIHNHLIFILSTQKKAIFHFLIKFHLTNKDSKILQHKKGVIL